MAEYALALLLALTKRLPAVVEDQGQRRWIRRESELLAGRTLGIVGLGSIGQAIARRARALGMRVVGTKRRAVKLAGIDRVYPAEALGDMLAVCDAVVVSVPHTPQTAGLVGAAELRAMKQRAYLINIARGEVVDESALRAALREGRIAGAASDVFAEEPLPPASPWYETPRLLISPHVAGNTTGWQQRALALFVENVERWRQGRRLRNVVDKQRGY
jgi:phosphoglycerate dehydrogenase-like enzyme